MKPLVLETIKEQTIWGNNILSQKRIHSNDPFGTWWEVSAHPYCSNRISNLEGNPTLQEVIDANPDNILGPGLDIENCLRLAYLDAKDDLSIQVHPDDEYAKAYANDNGKTESWYILDCKEGATLVAGTKTNDSNLIRSSLEDHTITKYLQKWEMHPGDFIVIPAGTLHALGKDILALEVGTNSNTTYRFYDYDRKDANGNKRPLHLKEIFDVLQAENQPIYVPASQTSHRLCDLEQFTVDEIYAESDISITCQEHYCIVSNISADTIEMLWKETTIDLPAYTSAFIPYSTQEITIPKGSHVLVSNPKRRD